MDAPRYCPQCGWPDAHLYEVVSRHRTTEGVIVYTRCVCGRLQVRGGDRVAIRQTGPALPTVDPTGLGTRSGAGVRAAASRASTVLVRSATSPTACLVGLVPVLVAVVTLPAPALLPLAALSLVVGVIARVEPGLSSTARAGATRVAGSAAVRRRSARPPPGATEPAVPIGSPPQRPSGPRVGRPSRPVPVAGLTRFERG